MTAIFLIAAAVLAIQVSYDSKLSLWVKQYFSLEKRHTSIVAGSKPAFWLALFGPYFILVGSPLALLGIVYCNAHLLLVEILNCAYCLSFYLGALAAYFIAGHAIILSIALGLVTLLIVRAIERYI